MAWLSVRTEDWIGRVLTGMLTAVHREQWGYPLLCQTMKQKGRVERIEGLLWAIPQPYFVCNSVELY